KKGQTGFVYSIGGYFWLTLSTAKKSNFKSRHDRRIIMGASGINNAISVGAILGTYEILSMLGRGGMGEVYLARDKRNGREVALKLLSASATDDKDRVRRFRREAQIIMGLNHPNILTIYEFGEIESIHFIATEYITGETL